MRFFSILSILFSIVMACGLPSVSSADEAVSQETAAAVLIGDRYDANGLLFIVKEAVLGEWLSMEQTQSLAIFSPPPKEAAPFLALRYDFINENPQKKVDLSDPFEFTLTDEFGNVYRQLQKPFNYPETTQFLNSSFPSVYPGERYGETVFFEAPIQSSQMLYFHIGTRNIGDEHHVVIKIPRSRVVSVDESFYRRLDVAKKQAADEKNQIGPIKIVRPKNGITVEPGETVHVEVEVPKNSRQPDNIFVMIPEYVLKDSELHYSYDLKVPATQTDKQLTVLVIGQWLLGEKEEILSDSIVLKIVDSSAL